MSIIFLKDFLNEKNYYIFLHMFTIPTVLYFFT